MPLYLAALLVSAAGVAVLDRRFRLVFWRRPGLAAAVVVVGTVFLLGWDLVCIALGVFARGSGPFFTGVMLAPELPLEEPVFLAFLCYVTLALLAGARRWFAGRGGASAPPVESAPPAASALPDASAQSRGASR